METAAVVDNWTLKGVSRDDEPGQPDAIAPHPARRRLQLGRLAPLAVGLIGLVALGTTAWVYAETQREIRRISNDIAQIRVSLELYGRQQAGSGEPAAADSADSAARLLDLSNRLALLEANQRNGSTVPQASALPALPAPAGGAVATGGDCLPVGMRFMVAAGDNYAVCGTTAKIAIAAIDNGYITLADGTVIAEGGTINLADSECMLGVMPGEGDGLSGYAEIRVAC